MMNHGDANDKSLRGSGQGEGESGGRGGGPNEEEIRAWLISNISDLVEVDPQQIDVQKPLEYYGIDSMQAMHLSGDLQDWLGQELSPTVVWDYPTIELLAHHLVDELKNT